MNNECRISTTNVINNVRLAYHLAISHRLVIWRITWPIIWLSITGNKSSIINKYLATSGQHVTNFPIIVHLLIIYSIV